MKIRFTVCLMCILCFTAGTLQANSLINCANGGSASIGDSKQKVRLSCGEPESIEIIGYIDKMIDQQRIRVMKIEEWIYKIPFYGEQQYYSLVFEGNKLVEIENVSSK